MLTSNKIVWSKKINLFIFVYVPEVMSLAKRPGSVYMHQHGLSRGGLNNGPIFGFSVAPRSIDRHNINLRQQYPSLLKQKIELSVKVQLSM